MVITHKQTVIDLNVKLSKEQANIEYSAALDEGKFDLLAIGKHKEGWYQVFKVFPHTLIERIGYKIIKKNIVVK